jgi:hypothetical protein
MARPTADESLDTIVAETMRTRYAWGQYRYLFVDEKPRVDVLNATASGFFAWVQALAADAVCMGISRLTDSAATGQENASLEQLLNLTGWERSDPQRFATLSAELEQVRTACKTCRAYRNKRLGHFDLTIALRIKAIPAVTVREIDTALASIEAFLGRMYTALRPDSSYLFEFLNPHDHVRPLFAKLTNRASQKHPDAVSVIRSKADGAGAELVCAFCGESADVYMMSDDIPDGRYLKLWHFNMCTGVVGVERVLVELTKDDGVVVRKLIDIGKNG